MKALKVINVILLTIMSAIEVFLLYCAITSISFLFSGEAIEIIGVVFNFLPLCLLAVGGEIVVAIFVNILTKVRKNLIEKNGLEKQKFDKVCLIICWSLLVLAIIAVVTLFVIIKLPQ